MPPTMALNLRSRIALLFAVALTIVGAAAPAREPSTARIVMTGNDSFMFPVIGANALDPEAAKTFEQALLEEKEKHPESYFVEAGRFVPIATTFETAYNYPSMKMFDTLGYSAVNLTPKDFALSSVVNAGFFKAPLAFRKMTISNLKSDFRGSGMEPLKYSPTSNADKEGSLPLAFISMGEPSSASGIGGIISFVEKQTIEPTRDEYLAQAREDGRVSIGFATGAADTVAARLIKGQPAPDVVVDFSLDRDAKPRREGDTWLVPAPAPGAYNVLEIERESDGSVGEPKIDRKSIVEYSKVTDYVDFPIPDLGLEVPNLDATMKIFFGITADSVRIDKVDHGGRSDLTSITNPNVYHATLDGQPVRIYRAMSSVPDSRIDGRRNGGWPMMDSLIAVDENSLLHRIEARSDRFTIMLLETSMLEALNRLKGEKPENWKPDPELTAGLEELWEFHADTIRKTLELDRLLYGPDGIYNKQKK